MICERWTAVSRGKYVLVEKVYCSLGEIEWRGEVGKELKESPREKRGISGPQMAPDYRSFFPDTTQRTNEQGSI